MTRPEFDIPDKCNNCSFLCSQIEAHYEFTDMLANDTVQSGIVSEREAIETGLPLHEQKARNAKADLDLSNITMVREVMHRLLQSQIYAYSLHCEGTHNPSNPNLQPCRSTENISE